MPINVNIYRLINMYYASIIVTTCPYTIKSIGVYKRR